MNEDRQQAILHAVIINNLHDMLGFTPVLFLARQMSQILHLQLDGGSLSS